MRKLIGRLGLVALTALAATGASSAPRPSTETAILAGGCFWGMEAVFEHVKGVQDVVSGYAGGAAHEANYETVSTERTKHAEAVRIRYDPRQISYPQLLRIYFSVAHDPTQVNRQGPDVGPSHRSAIFPQNEGQRKIAATFISQLRAQKHAIATRLEGGRFYPAEAYHQDFMRKNPMHPYILVHDRPKLAKLKKRYPDFWRA